MTKQWDEITIAELFEASRKERSNCLELARKSDDLTRKALVDRSNKHGTLYHEVKFFISNPEEATVRNLLDLIEVDRLACLELERIAIQYRQSISANAFRRQGNHYELLYQEIMYFVNKLS